MKIASNKVERILIEDALKHIHQSSHELSQPATAESLAGALHKNRREASWILEKLRKANYAQQQHKQWTLTPEGDAYAITIIRAHRLYETFLAREGRSPEHIHKEAEAKEHKLSKKEIEALAQKLGHPRFDPHGDPIPTAKGKLPKLSNLFLSDCQKGFNGTIEHLEDEPASVYAEILAMGIAPGMHFHIRESDSDSLFLSVEGSQQKISHFIAANIHVKASEEEHKEVQSRLIDLPKGHRAIIHGISQACQGPERRRLLDLGIVPGSSIEMVRQGILGNPLAYRIRGTQIALRKEQAHRIYISLP